MLKIDAAEEDRPVVIDGYEYETPRSAWRVSAVRALPRHRLHVTFRDGLSGCIDMSGFVAREDSGVFHSLRDEKNFADVSVVFGAVTWANGVDMAPDAMYDEIRKNGGWILR